MHIFSLLKFKWQTAYLLLFMLLCISACSSTQPITKRAASENVSEKSTNQQKAAQAGKVMSEEELLFSLLRNEYRYWRGTPYRLGGSNKNGIDCSALVQAVFKNSFNMAVARTTSRQLKLGSPVAADVLQVADLVFFKIRRGVRHVGIYIGAQQFLHASTSQGVMISSLQNSYWQSKYWQARRILY